MVYFASLPIASLSDGHVAAIDANGVTGRTPFDAGDDGVKRFRIEDVTTGVRRISGEEWRLFRVARETEVRVTVAVVRAGNLGQKIGIHNSIGVRKYLNENVNICFQINESKAIIFKIKYLEDNGLYLKLTQLFPFRGSPTKNGLQNWHCDPMVLFWQLRQTSSLLSPAHSECLLHLQRVSQLSPT